MSKQSEPNQNLNKMPGKGPNGMPGKGPGGMPGKGPNGMPGKGPEGMPGKGPGGRPPKMRMPKGVLKRVIKMLFADYPVLVPATMFCIIFASVAASVPDLFIQKVIAIVEKWQPSGDWASAWTELWPKMLFLVIMYVIALAALTLYNQLMAYITQGFLHKTRKAMFDKMQSLPIRYFDSNKTGDIMSHYTNDLDTVRQLISQSLPTILRAGVVVLSVFGIMLYLSVWMTLVVLVGTVFMIMVARVAGAGSAKYFIAQQKSLGRTEGYIQEMMNGQRVIKVFNHEKPAMEGFDEVNEQLFRDGYQAHARANTLGPVIMNIGNILYVIVAIVGGIFLLSGTKNVSISGLAFSISVVVPFLNMTKQFTANMNQVSQQLNTIIMALAGAKRCFELMDEEPEEDHGKRRLVRVNVAEDGTITESEEVTGHWAWRLKTEDGGWDYILLQGDIRLNHVNFGYRPDHEILHDITLYAKPGQKVAFVGATGAGKTTITNLLNRFYDIHEGSITYDGIDISTIRKQDLRRSLGLVLQDVNLFTGTVMENIRYGKLDATDEECIAAAKLANADSFINMLPEGYQTVLSGDGGGLSQGQRQLISIARAAVANPPVMILDEATSSIDTRTEALVQQGMDSLMAGRTTFVIAHRLSTVRNANVIMVLENGRIIERGTHEQLLEEKGQYYQLYTGAFELE